MKPLDEMTKLEKNMEIAGYLGTVKSGSDEYWGSGAPINYCENWNDLMPLIVRHGIDLNFIYTTGDWLAIKAGDSLKAEHINPQVALVNCLLLVLRSKAEENSNGG